MSRFLLVKVGWKCHSGPKVSLLQAQEDVARRFQGSEKVAARQWNQFQTSVTVPMKVAQGRHRAKDICAGSLFGTKRSTASQLTRDLSVVSGNSIRTFCTD
ncbi:hypothetical protein TNCV_3070611 [Trichonephila clavipes]|nr:hypothetical protein TNCV_3070611 [Trichonephila clavipes]